MRLTYIKVGNKYVVYGADAKVATDSEGNTQLSKKKALELLSELKQKHKESLGTK